MFEIIRMLLLLHVSDARLCSCCLPSTYCSAGLQPSQCLLALNGVDRGVSTGLSLPLYYPEFLLHAPCSSLPLLIHIWHGWVVILPEENWKRSCAAPQYVLPSTVWGEVMNERPLCCSFPRLPSQRSRGSACGVFWWINTLDGSVTVNVFSAAQTPPSTQSEGERFLPDGYRLASSFTESQTQWGETNWQGLFLLLPGYL